MRRGRQPHRGTVRHGRSIPLLQRFAPLGEVSLDETLALAVDEQIEGDECRRTFAGLTLVVERLRRLPAAQPARTPAQLAASVRVRLGQPPGA